MRTMSIDEQNQVCKAEAEEIRQILDTDGVDFKRLLLESREKKANFKLHMASLKDQDSDAYA